MLEAINKVRELQGEHGALRKRELLRKYKDDNNFCKLLYYALNPMKSVEQFRNQHYVSCGNGSRYIFELTGTGIGEAISIQCPVCGERKDVTDVENW